MVTQANADRWFMANVRNERLVGDAYIIIKAHGSDDALTILSRVIGKHVSVRAFREIRHFTLTGEIT